MLVTKSYDNLQKQIDAISLKKREEWKESLKDYFKHRTQYQAINSVIDLSSAYESQYSKKPDKIELEIFEELLPEIVKVSKDMEGVRRMEQNKMTSVGILRPTKYGYERNAFFNNILSENQNSVTSLQNEIKHQSFINLVDKRNSASQRLAILQELIKIMTQELEGLTYPKYIKFGFASFVMFAVLGVFVPLLYNTWEGFVDESISKVLVMPIENNALVLILFTIGLTLNFVYIGLELREATLK